MVADGLPQTPNSEYNQSTHSSQLARQHKLFIAHLLI